MEAVYLKRQGLLHKLDFCPFREQIMHREASQACILEF